MINKRSGMAEYHIKKSIRWLQLRFFTHKMNIGNRRSGKAHKPYSDKMDWEFSWQRDNWSPLYSKAEVKVKVYEYWIKYRFLDEIRKHVVFDQNTVILDVGCGISTVLHYLPGHRFGIDPLVDKYKTIYMYPRDLKLCTGYGENIPFRDNCFDVIVCSNCIDHTDSPKQTIKEIQRVLRQGGHLIMTCEVFSKDLGQRNPGHPHSMNLETLWMLLDGFQIMKHYDSPWIGLSGYIQGEPPTAQREHIFLARKP